MRFKAITKKVLFLFFLFIQINVFSKIDYEHYEKQGKLNLELQTGSKNVYSIAISPDGNLIATGDSDIKLWHKDGKLIRTFKGHRLQIRTLSFSPDGNFIISGCDDKTVRIWKIDGTLIKVLNHSSMGGWQGEVKRLSFLDNDKFITFADSGYIHIWNLKGEQEKKYFIKSKSKKVNIVKKAAVNQSLNRIIILHKSIEIFDFNGNSIKLISFKGNDVAIHPQGKSFAVAIGKNIQLYTINGILVKTIDGHNKSINVVNYSSDGKFLVTGSNDKTVRIYSSNGEFVNSFSTNSIVKSISFSPNNSSLFVGLDNGLLDHIKKDGTFVKTMGQGPGKIMHIAVSSDGSRFYTKANGENIIRIWDINGSPISFLQTDKKDYVQDIKFGRSAKNLVMANTKFILIRDKNGKLIKKFNPNHDRIERLAVSNNGKFIVSVGYERVIKLWSLKGKLLKSYKSSYSPDAVAISPNNKVVVIGDGAGYLHILTRRNTVKKFYSGISGITSIAFGKNSSSFVCIGSESIMMFNDKGKKLWETTTATAASKKAKTYNFIRTADYSKDGKYVVIGMYNGGVKLYHKNGKIYKNLIGHTDFIEKINFLPNSKYVMSASSDLTLRVFNIKSGKSYVLVSLGNDWLVYTNEGYWDGSADGGRFVAMTKGLSVWAVDQFALKNNRPDLILKHMGLGSVKLKKHYYAQYLKRLRKSGFTEREISKELHIPQAKIIKVKQKGKFISLSYKLKDSKYNIKNYNVYINDVPLYGSYGKKIEKKTATGTEEIELIYGVNKIEISCINNKGAESIRDITYAQYNKKTKGNLYFLGFGVSKYKNKKLNLKYADQDAFDLKHVFKVMKTQYKKVYVKTYTNNQVTVKNIKKAKRFIRKANVDDTFVLFIAGHGIHDIDREATYYYLTYQSDIRKLKKTAANFELIEDILQGIKPRNKLFLMDTCESGEVDGTSTNNYFYAAKKRGIKPRTIRGLTVKKRKVKRTYLFQKDRYIYNDLVRRSGAIVFSSSKGGEFSYESDLYKNGHFTEEIINALKGKADNNNNGMIEISELVKYVQKAVKIISSNLQHPTVDRNNIYIKFSFPKVK